MQDIALQKKQLRRQCFSAVQAMTVDEKRVASNRICQQIQSLPEFVKARVVFGFLPLPSEPDLTPLFGSDKIWGFSRVRFDDTLEFREMTDLSLAIKGDFKIREPNPETCPILLHQEADLILIPGVGFCHESGNRLGRGKGHYDRFLEKCLTRPQPPTLVGVCFAAQICRIPVENHDRPMDKILYS
jgi:5-formyltetrahydrofolate cyclo-ligase